MVLSVWGAAAACICESVQATLLACVLTQKHTVIIFSPLLSISLPITLRFVQMANPMHAVPALFAIFSVDIMHQPESDKHIMGLPKFPWRPGKEPRLLTAASGCLYVQVEIKTTPDTANADMLQKAADFVHAFILGEQGAGLEGVFGRRGCCKVSCRCALA
jgi:hypothetical protein